MMSETTTPATPPATSDIAQAAEAPKKPEPPPEPPFSIDVLQGSTSKFTRKGWDEFQRRKHDLDLVKTEVLKVTFEARSPQDVVRLRQELEAAGHTGFTQKGVYLGCPMTLATLQEWVRNSMIKETHVEPIA
jgi:hypothetical protein